MPSLGAAALESCPRRWSPEAHSLNFWVSDQDDGGLESVVTFTTSNAGPALRCHEGVLRARCPTAPVSAGTGTGSVLHVDERAEVVFVLLRWVFCEAVDASALDEFQTGGCSNAAACAVRLGRAWGLRDCSSFQARVAAGRAVEQARGSLAEDVLRAYDAGELSDGWQFQADEGEPLLGGCATLLRQRSNYFRAMLSGAWVEAQLRAGGRTPIQVHCPRDLLLRLLRFLHGASMADGLEDLGTVLECGKFFEVPSLISHVGDWIAAHLHIENAATLWKIVEDEPALLGGRGSGELEDADAACFEFHLRNFTKLANLDDDGSRDVERQLLAEEIDAAPQHKKQREPLHELSPPLMRRLLASGLIDVPSPQLKLVVKKFAKAHTKGQPPSAYNELWQSLKPPAVLFNRDTRNSLLYNNLATARLFASMG